MSTIQDTTTRAIHGLLWLSSFTFGMLLMGTPRDFQLPGIIAGAVVLTCNIVAAFSHLARRNVSAPPEGLTPKATTRVGFIFNRGQ